MASDGDTITYTFSGAKETEDISDIGEVVIQNVGGADGEDGTETNGGSGGLIENATADVSEYDTLEIWVGGLEYGKAKSRATLGTPGGGSTEIYANEQSVSDTGLSINASDGKQVVTLSQTPTGDIIAARDSTGTDRLNDLFWVRLRDAQIGENVFNPSSDDSYTITEIDYHTYDAFVAAADGGGGGATTISGPFADSDEDGTGGARGDGDANFADSIEGEGFGGVAGVFDSGTDGGAGGQELGIASGGTTTTGGSSEGAGEITIEFKRGTLPITIDGTELTEITIDGDPVIGLTIDGDVVL